MAQVVNLSLLLLPLLLLTLVSGLSTEHSAVHRRSRARAFIEFQCRTTLYSDLCVQMLSYSLKNATTPLTHRQLSQMALRITLIKAQSTQAYVTKVAKELKQTKAKDYQEVAGCLDQINDGVEQLKKCVLETQKIKDEGNSDFPWHASNVQTWMSTALTDSSMCIDGFSGRAIGGKTKAIIKAKVVNLQEVTSISLALFNRFAARFKSSYVKKPKAL